MRKSEDLSSTSSEWMLANRPQIPAVQDSQGQQATVPSGPQASHSLVSGFLACAALVLGGAAGLLALRKRRSFELQEQTGLQKLGQATAGVLSASILAMHGLMPPVAYGQELLLQTPPPKTAPAKPAIRLTPSELSTVQLFQRNTPSVVYITNLQSVMRADPISPGSLNLQRTEIPRGSGTGFVWDDSGHIVTNFHVIAGATDLTVTTMDQAIYRARLVGADPDKDVAVLQVTDKDAIQKFRPVKVGSCSNLMVGQRVFAIGNPFGLDHTLTQGIVSGLGRVINSPSDGRPISGVIQTDAVVNPGNSGGPLLDVNGRVIGINSAILDPTQTGSYSGVSFAIPIDTVKGVVGQLLSFGRVLKPVLGISVAPDSILQSLNEKGVLVLGCAPGSPAARAGLHPSLRDQETGRMMLGDIITKFDDEKVDAADDLYSALDRHRPGDEVTITVVRADGMEKPKFLPLKVVLGE